MNKRTVFKLRNNKKPLNLFSAGNFDHKGGMKKGEVYILYKKKNTKHHYKSR